MLLSEHNVQIGICEHFCQDLWAKLVSHPIFVSFQFLAELALAARLYKCRRFFFFSFICSRQMVNHGPRRWSEVNPETLGVWQIEGDSSLNLVSSSTGHRSSENQEAEGCVFATGCFLVTETPFGISEASGVKTSLYYRLRTK